MIEDINSRNYSKKLRVNTRKGINGLLRLLNENPNPVFRISDTHTIIYANETGKLILQQLGIKGKKIPKKLIGSITKYIKKRSDYLMDLVLEISGSIYAFNIVRPKDENYYNIYGNDITDLKAIEKSRQKKEGDIILHDDRNYIARELHDTVTQTLFSANLIAEVLPQLWKKDPESVITRLKEVRMLNNLALTEMRALLFDLRPSSFKNEDLSILLKQLVKTMGVKSKIPISVEIVKKYVYPSNIELSFYRIAQEALNNILKHAFATQAILKFKSLPTKLSLEVVDNGLGFDPNETSVESLGLIIMKERAKIINAALNINSSPGEGTKISLVYKNRNKTNK